MEVLRHTMGIRWAYDGHTMGIRWAYDGHTIFNDYDGSRGNEMALFWGSMGRMRNTRHLGLLAAWVVYVWRVAER
jgi:hypothetical protein